MALNLNYTYTQQYYQGIDALNLKAVARDILANAQAKSTVETKSVDVDLYNGAIDAMTAKQVAMSGTALQVTLNNNLETAVKFLKTKAAETVKSSEIPSIAKAKQGMNPFNNGSSKKEASEYLFIKAA